jgi:hypothetical protein
MAEFKRRTLILSTGKQIKLYGESIAIGKSLEIGEGAAPNIFFESVNHSTEKISNPHHLTAEELHELADYNIGLWMDLKAAIRKHGMDSSKIFNPDALR